MNFCNETVYTLPFLTAGNLLLIQRLDILEALEAAVGDVEDVRMNRRGILHIQRDFNE